MYSDKKLFLYKLLFLLSHNICVFIICLSITMIRIINSKLAISIANIEISNEKIKKLRTFFVSFLSTTLESVLLGHCCSHPACPIFCH